MHNNQISRSKEFQMTSNEFAKLMTSLTQQDDWPEAYKQILAEIESNDPRLNALIDHFFQPTPKTDGENRMIMYLLLSSMKMLALDHLGRLKNYTLQQVLGQSKPWAARQ
jgi:hypothetical protein